MSIEAMKQALKVLEYPGPSWIDGRQTVITSLRQAIQEVEQEPVGWYDCKHQDFSRVQRVGWEAIYTHPQPKREWVGLTDDEHYELADKAGCMSADWVDYARDIEAKLKEKNT